MQLRNLSSQLNLIQSEELKYIVEYPDIGNRKECCKMSLYNQSNSNNYILFANYDDTTVNSTCNGIRNEAYDYLINKLNTLNNVFVCWSQIEGTTSDYTIFYNFDKYEIGDVSSMTVKDIDAKLDGIIEKSNNQYRSFKYLEVDNYVVTNMTKYF